MPCPQSPQFAVSAYSIREVTVLSGSGDIDLSTAPLLAEQSALSLADHPAALVFDLTKVDFMASAGLKVLMNAQRAGAAKVVVVADGRAVRRPFVLAGSAGSSLCTRR
ncbi:STAS domain-containing protein [Mycobacterium sp.]|uniref:STAS domain-containing protein n=1 Tax=Mycobacterium sp. TaxID=1785 RepID=UPI0025D7F8E5|nr:STAS domain-containing protein [Mycobacterium sp.]